MGPLRGPGRFVLIALFLLAVVALVTRHVPELGDMPGMFEGQQPVDNSDGEALELRDAVDMMPDFKVGQIFHVVERFDLYTNN